MYRILAKYKGKGKDKNEKYESVTRGNVGQSNLRPIYFKTKSKAQAYAKQLKSFDTKIVKKKSKPRSKYSGLVSFNF